MLRGLVDECISSIPVASLQEIWFQHDGTFPHTSNFAKSFLCKNSSSRLIGAGEQFLGQ